MRAFDVIWMEKVERSEKQKIYHKLWSVMIEFIHVLFLTSKQTYV